MFKVELDAEINRMKLPSVSGRRRVVQPDITDRLQLSPDETGAKLRIKRSEIVAVRQPRAV
ncbi:hypothetical protein OJ998_15610 [Solirubrobacter taibaiensis]|nr:hypothetical protein [Solirubrobacter taibaiensis]